MSPAGRSSSADAWDVFRVENLALGRIHQCTPQLSTGSLFRYLHFRFSSSLLSPKRNITAKRTWSPIFLNQTTRTGPPSSLIPTSRIPGGSLVPPLLPPSQEAPGGSQTITPAHLLCTMATAIPSRHPPRGGRSSLPFHLRMARRRGRSEEHTSELQSLAYLVCRLLLEKKNKQ